LESSAHPVAQHVPLLDLQAQYATIRGDVIAAITRVCDSQRFILGPEVESLERELAGFLGVPHAIGVSSGTDALLVALMALGVGAGDEVVTSPFSFFATAGSIARVGARPVFVDIDPVTFNLDPERLASALTSKTKAIMPVHLFGQSADLAPILEIARRAHIPVVEDAAQAVGARYGDESVGSFGALGCFSFFPTKNLGGFGDSGLVTTRDATLARQVRSLRQHGMEVRYHHDHVGANFRLDAIQAAVLRVKLPHLPAWTAGRHRNAERYHALFAQSGLTEHVRLPVQAPGRSHVYNQFVVRVPDRDRLRAHLLDHGVGTEIYYPVPLHLQVCFKDLGYQGGAFPVAEAAAREVLALPIYAELTEAQQAWVVEAMRNFFTAPASSRG
jgi:dTDP-4-amino-4,6-dideoxygalactose transaminase